MSLATIVLPNTNKSDSVAEEDYHGRSDKDDSGSHKTAAISHSHGVLSGSKDRHLRLWDLEAGRSVASIKAHQGGVKFCSVLSVSETESPERHTCGPRTHVRFVSGSAGHNTGNAVKFWKIT